MPSVQPLVSRAILTEKIDKLIRDMRKYIRDLPHGLERTELNNKLNLLYRTDTKVRYKTVKPVKVTTVFRKCPCNKCKGFLNKKWTCGICTTRICAKCNEPRGSASAAGNARGHVCDPESVETMKLLRKDTKGCPSCGTMISKISGCSQMWCPDCHTTFDWNTMQVDTGIQHNPHYFEYMRKNGGLARQPGDVPACRQAEGLPAFYEIMTMNLPDDHYQFVAGVYRGANHLIDAELNKYRSPIKWGASVQGLLIDYMRNKISEDKFKDTLQREEKYREKTQEFRHICEMYVNVTGDNIRQLGRDRNYQEFNTKAMGLKAYAEECFKKIGNRYKCVVPKIVIN